ncbi:beta-ribofuranosylaminobenzene 5'-phosphate synthase family protein [Thermococcus sp.]
MIIETPKRVHFGLIDPSASLGRRFGGLGVAVEGGYVVRVERGGEGIKAGKKDRETIEAVLRTLREAFGIEGSYSIEVLKGIPRHVGLGSTTQLSLAVAKAVSSLEGLNLGTAELARALGRGRDSGVGIYTFEFGGFVIDGGIGKDIPPLIVRHDFPEEWALILITPELKAGPDEREERNAMDSSFGSAGIAARISHRVLLGLLPALVERDIESFGAHLTAIQRLVGRQFSGFQGGEFRPDLGAVLSFLRERTYGCGQSSWGPTVYGLITREDFKGLKGEVEDYLRELGLRARIELGVPRNRGFSVG